MESRIFLWELYDYELESEKSKKTISKNPYFDLEQIPSSKMQNEIFGYIMQRSTKIGCAKMYAECNEFRKLCKFFREYCKDNTSLLDKTSEVWIRQLKRWMMKEGIPLSVNSKQVTGKQYRFKSRLITLLENILKFIQVDNRQEQEKDIWELDKLDITYRKDLIRNRKRLIFTQIVQDEIREEVKKGIYLNLQNEAINCVAQEITAMRRLSSYLQEKYLMVNSCKDINREVLEDYLTYLKTEHGDNRHLRAEINRLRKILETIGQIYDYSNLCTLFLTRDIPSSTRTEFKRYSDDELKRLNAAIVRMNEQDARVLVIHQMLGTRISDTLLLETDCLYKKNGENIIRIHQMKTRTYEKPISEELAVLIQKAIEYTKEHYGDTSYIFVNDKDPMKPMPYSTLQVRVIKMIREEGLRDDNGELFGFGTHIFRHCYGAKLTELHLDDWTIAKLLGHTSVKNVKYYRKMSNQLLTDETREARQELSDIIFNNLNGWEKEYEQVRQNACLE